MAINHWVNGIPYWGPNFIPEGLSPLDWLVLAVSWAVLGPFAEETAWRGIALTGLRARIPAWAAVVLISIVFALYHANPFSACIDRTVFGIVVGIMAIENRSLVPCFVAHGLVNGWIVFAHWLW